MTKKSENLFDNNELKLAIIYCIENNVEPNKLWKEIRNKIETPSFTLFLFYLYKLNELKKYNIIIPKINITTNFYNKLIKILLINEEKLIDTFPITNHLVIDIINNYDIKLKNLMKLLIENNISIPLSKIKDNNKKNFIKVIYLKKEIKQLKILQTSPILTSFFIILVYITNFIRYSILNFCTVKC